MTNLIPGFLWIPVDIGARPARVKGRGLVGHVAVSTSRDLRPGPLATRSADWHAYLPKTGPGIQYIDLDVQCWANRDGNKTMAAFESEGGMGTADQVNAEPWTDDQCEAAAKFLAHLHRTEGVPLQVMPDSRPTSRGFGPHRLGIDPWRVTGGELWSSARGKLCPGNAKVAQVPAIVARAAQIANPTSALEDDMTPAQAAQLTQILDLLTPGKPGVKFDGDVYRKLTNASAGVAALLARSTDIDPTKLASAIVDSMPDDLARQVADELGKRLNTAPTA